MANTVQSKEELDELREIFRIVDRDDGGTITRDELAYLMDTLGIRATDEDISSMMKELDANHNGEIEFDEFVKVISQKVAASFTADQVKSAFKVFEGANCADGEIDRDDLIDALTTHGTTKLTEVEANDLIKQLETNTDGRIDYNTYVDMMMTD